MKIISVILVLFAISTIGANYLPIPSGLAHSSCIHEVPSGSIVSHDKQGQLIVSTPSGELLNIPKCEYPFVRNAERSNKPQHGAAWKTCAQYENTNSITYLYGEWEVPPNPIMQTNQILYFWNGVEPEDNSAVVQPVLQFGATPAGGGYYWAMASWFVSFQGAVFSNLINTTVGSTVSGENSYNTNGTWFATGKDIGSQQSTTLGIDPGIAYYYAYEVLESYYISSCNQYPSTGVVSFTNIQVQAGGLSVTPQWKSVILDDPCQENTVIVNPTEVQITFNVSD